jgi:hypothetical protein
MKAFLSKRILGLLIAPAFLFAFTFKADRTNFSGEWKLNEGKSELGEFARFATKVIKAEQKQDAMTISKTAPTFNGDDATVTETLTFDGKEIETTVFGTAKRKSTAKWSEDGKTFTINYTLVFEFNGQTSEVKGSEVWTLSEDGKALNLQINASSPQGELSSKAVYDKQ